MILRTSKLFSCLTEPEFITSKTSRMIAACWFWVRCRTHSRVFITQDLIYPGMRLMLWNYEQCSKQWSRGGFHRKKRSTWKKLRNTLTSTPLNCLFRKIELKPLWAFISEQSRLLCSRSTLSRDKGRFHPSDSAKDALLRWEHTTLLVRKIYT